MDGEIQEWFYLFQRFTWRECDLDDGADAAVAPDDLDLVEDLREQLVDQLHEAERAVDLPQLGGRDVGLQLVALASLHHIARD
jgi:hypothetical protein